MFNLARYMRNFVTDVLNLVDKVTIKLFGKIDKVTYSGLRGVLFSIVFISNLLYHIGDAFITISENSISLYLICIAYILSFVISTALGYIALYLFSVMLHTILKKLVEK